MTHVVTDACIRCKYTDCVDVCSVGCLKERHQYLQYRVIDFLEFNKKLAPGLPTITRRMPPLPDAEQWRVVSHKLSGLNVSV